MNWRAIRAIAYKDVMVALRTKAVVLPLIILPLTLMAGIPGLLGILAGLADQAGVTDSDFQQLVRSMPEHAQASVAGMTDVQAGLVYFLVYLFAPMYLILPLMVSSVVAADSFAGEKERKTLEALAYTPTTDRELLLAKMLGGWVPGILVGLGGFVVYTIVCDLITLWIMGTLVMPNLLWLLLALWVGPAAAALGLGVTVIASSRVNTFQEAYQIGSLVVLPVVLLVVGQATGLFLLNIWLVVIWGAALWLIDAAVFAIGAGIFRRSELMARL